MRKIIIDNLLGGNVGVFSYKPVDIDFGFHHINFVEQFWFIVWRSDSKYKFIAVKINIV